MRVSSIVQNEHMCLRAFKDGDLFDEEGAPENLRSQKYFLVIHV